MLFDTRHIQIDELSNSMLSEKKIQLRIARLDKIHPVVSGNKIFKLHFFLQEAIAGNQPVVTFGGAYSNHLVAAAYACKKAGLICTGIVRGEQPVTLSPTLENCMQQGMKLIFVSREDYEQLAQGTNVNDLPGQHANPVIIPEGGYHPKGASGAALIYDAAYGGDADVIITAVGTATTLAGLLKEATKTQKIIAVPVLKNMTDIPQRIAYLNNAEHSNLLETWDNYHFGGYAKKTAELIAFMNALYLEQQLPTDFVYTAKMMFAVMDKIRNNYFPEHSKILCLHTGGLQGNQSIATGSLVF